MKTFSIKEAITSGWQIYKGDKKRFILVSLIYVLIQSIQNSDRFTQFDSVVLNIFIGVFLFAFGTIVHIGWTKTMLKVLDGGRAQVKDLFQYWRLFVRYIKTFILFIIIPAVPALIGAAITVPLRLISDGVTLPTFFVIIATFIVIIFYLILRYAFALMLVIDREEMGVFAAFKKSAEMTQGIKLKLIGLGLVLGVINILGCIALLVGLLITIPVSTLATLSIYRKLFNDSNAVSSPVSVI